MECYEKDNNRPLIRNNTCLLPQNANDDNINFKLKCNTIKSSNLYKSKLLNKFGKNNVIKYENINNTSRLESENSILYPYNDSIIEEDSNISSFNTQNKDNNEKESDNKSIRVPYFKINRHDFRKKEDSKSVKLRLSSKSLSSKFALAPVSINNSYISEKKF